MNKEIFLQQLSSLISDLPDNERATILDFYREIIEDKMESGVSEAEAIAGLGDIHQLAQKILMENPNRKPPQHTKKAGIIVLCCILCLSIVAGIIFIIASSSRKIVVHVGNEVNSSAQGKVVVNGEEIMNKDNEEKTFTAKAAGVTKIKLQAENKSIHIVPADDDEIKIDYVSNQNQTYKFSNDTGVVSMDNYDSHSGFTFFDFFDNDESTITVKVPAQYANDISIDTTNSEIVVSDLKKLHDVSCTTTNSAINLSDVCVNSVKIDTKNAAITMKNVEAQKSLEALTKNAKIDLTKITSPEISLKTENGIISGTITGREEDYTIDSSTTNGVNNLQNRSNGSKKLTVATTNAIINVKFTN